MKKVIFSLLVVGCLFGSITVYAGTYSGNDFSSWYKEKFQESKSIIFTPFIEDNLFEVSISEKSDSLIEENKKSLDTFLATTISNSKKEVSNYQDTYLNRLAEVKESLLEKKNQAFIESKEQELYEEIMLETEEMLAEILSE